MKKIAVALLCLFILSGCVNSYPQTEVDELDNTTTSIQCVEGTKIWVMKYRGGNKAGLTSQIVGSCDINE